MRNCLLISAVFLLIYSYFKPSILPVIWYQGLLGGVLGFGILFILMFIGRKIYKQDAMGGGDLFILAFGDPFINGLFVKSPYPTNLNRRDFTFFG